MRILKYYKTGSIEAKNGNFSGNIFLEDGGEIIGGKGLLTNLTFTGSGIVKTASLGNFYQVGLCRSASNSSNFKSRIDIDAYIPENFEIENAVVIISHFAMNLNYNGTSYGKGYSRNLNIYSSDMKSRNLDFYIGSEYQDVENSNLQKISGAMDNWTPDISNNKVDTIISKNIKSSLKNGLNRIVVQSDDEIIEYDNNYNDKYLENGLIAYLQRTGMVSVTLQVHGYMKPEKKEDEPSE